jgi:anaerobic selenocysteine-containing dehydrogenase/Fe-S-cluster-containing dehydrogenase component
MPDLDRRGFLKLVGLGAGAAAGCSDPVEKLIPYVVQPEEITPGIAVYYASTCRECPAACGLHVRTREGRPVKLEGNPQHPINRGTLCARGQAAIGRTYHPDRHQTAMARAADGGLEEISWEVATGRLAAQLRTSAGKTWVLGRDGGPTVNDIIDRFVGGIGAAGRVIYEPFALGALRAATEVVFGVGVTPVFDLSGVDFILDFGSDFLDGGASPVELARQWADARGLGRPEGGGALQVSIGPRLSATASSADQWIPAAAGSEGIVALALAGAVYQQRKKTGKPIPGAARRLLERADLGDAAVRAGVDRGILAQLAEQLTRSRSAVALPPGVALTSQRAVSTASAVMLLNALLGAVGRAVSLPARETARTPASGKELGRLVEAMRAGQVDVLLVMDGNPVYSLPPDLGFQQALARVGTLVSFAPLADETSSRADLVLPDHTPLESWGDAEPRAGVRSLQQPSVRPLCDTRAAGDTLLELGRALGVEDLPTGSVRDILEANWSELDLRQALSRGGVFGETPTQSAEIAASVAGLDVRAPELEGDGDYVLLAHPHPLLGDGRGAALPWLQEIPDPVTKATWQSWAEVSPETARRLGVGFGDVIAIETGFGPGRVEVPVYPRGGVRDDVVALAIGQGHSVGYFASLAGDHRPDPVRGANVISVLPARTDEAGGRVWLGTRASLTPTGGFRRIPITQWTDNQRGRELAPLVELSALAAAASERAGAPVGDHAASHAAGDPGEPAEKSHHQGPPFEYDPANDGAPGQPYRWGMVVDNDRCTGCSACVAACYIENNVPVVGESGMIRHREMSWIRIERYVGDGDRRGGEQRRPHPDREQLGQADIRNVPMLCQHCGAAPCEAVCPVIATYHTTEGINGMVYNRCVGTRYCGNNCVYKVRRFNYFDYGRDNFPGLLRLMLNPDVTVRNKGVMEKCSFCIQRIDAARQKAKDENREIRDGEVVTACQQSCPTQAIRFGNTRDPNSAVVAKADRPARAFASLQDLNTRPGITYLAQVDRLADDERSPG